MIRLPRPAVAILSLGLAPLALAGCGPVHRAAEVATGFVSHQLCSAAFVSGLDPEAFYAEGVAPTLGPVKGMVGHRVDREHRAVTSTFIGVESQAVYRGPYGCLVLRGPEPPAEPVAQVQPAPPLLPAIAGPDLVEPGDPALKAALDRAFEEPSAPHRGTKAVVIVRDGRVIAERYAPGYGIDTPQIGWSMTKSVTNALIGILVRQGKVSVDGPAPIAAWADPGDPRHAITIDNLLRMTSGLDIGQSLTSSATDAFDPSARMVYAERDMAGFAERAPLRFAPGSQWNYTNGNTLLLSRIVRDNAGGTAASTLAFARRELFDKLGMEHATLEFDATGTPIGSSHMLASARDWARFGLLFLNDGVVGGERLLPEGWVDYSARPTPHSEAYGYGAGFWTNRGKGEGARYRIATGIPADSFMARGAYGQYVAIVPSQRLVVVRLGMSFAGRTDVETIGRLIADVAALTAHKGE
ncbi:MAG: serine hydrolase [Proteobacteria bacterium]|nr:serine hydrolase [Pseudomonadota bacterium]